MTLLDSLKAARRVSTPLVAIQSPDGAATIKSIVAGINGNVPKVQWDFCGGLTPLDEAGRVALAAAGACPDCAGAGNDSNGVCSSCGGRRVRFDPADTPANPAGTMSALRFLPAKTMVFVKNAQRFLDDIGFVQGVSNLRDMFKQDHRTLILLGPSIRLPAELVNDVVVFDEPLPDATAASEIIRTLHNDAQLDCDEGTLTRATAAVQGLPAFQIEQQCAMCLTPDGLDLEALWEAKRRQIEQTPGLKILRDRVKFGDLAGLSSIKTDILSVLHGNSPPQCVVWIDEISDALSGRNDATGVIADQIRELLTYMERVRADGYLMIGPPGVGKSAISGAAGFEAGVPTIQMDLGGMLGSLVGDSQRAIRTAIKVIDAVSGGNALWLGTANDLDRVPPQLKSRFSMGTYYFSLLSEKEREVAWGIHTRAYGITQDTSWMDINSDGWTGREIRNCCKAAWKKRRTIAQAAQQITPYCVTDHKQLEELQAKADGRWLDASHPGLYRRQITRESAVRAVKLTD